MKINELLNIKYPFIQGGMANISTGEFAAAVSNAGGLGLIGSGGMTAEKLRENIKIAKELTDKPFGVNLMLMNPQIDEMAKVVVDEEIRIITTGAGNPAKYLEMWKLMGAKVFPVVASVALARRMEKYGVAGVIAEGTESGGHVGKMTTLTLVPQIVDAVEIPVIAAGGIGDGRQAAAAFALGASGVQIGTAMLATVECPIHENYKKAIVKSKDNDTVVTGLTTGAPVRVIRNKMAKEYIKLENKSVELEELEKLTLGSLRKAVFDGDIKMGSLMAGQVCGQIKEILKVEDFFDKMFNDMHRTAHTLCNL